MKTIKLAIILLAFAIGMFTNKILSLEPTTTAKVTNIPADQIATIIPIDQDLKNYECHSLKKLDGNFLQFCKRKEAIKRISGEHYEAGTYLDATDSILIDKNLDTCGIMHELGHSQGLNESQAYELSNLCYQLKQKNLWKQ